MNDWQNDPDRSAAEHIAARLRAPVQLDDTFEVRVMSAVHAEALARVDAAHKEKSIAEEAAHPWWRRRFTLHVSPLGGLAMAAGVFGLMLIGATTFGDMIANAPPAATMTPEPIAAAHPVATENVHFVLLDGSAKQVWLVGDFNGWAKTATPLSRDASGNAWAVSVAVPRGRHEYAFIVSDGRSERWLADPRSPLVRDEFDTESSVLHVGAPDESAEATTF